MNVSHHRCTNVSGSCVTVLLCRNHQPDVFEPGDKFADCHPDFHSCQRYANAEMRACAEGEMAGQVLAVVVELARKVIQRLIVIARGKQDQQARAFGKLLAAQFDCLGRTRRAVCQQGDPGVSLRQFTLS
jgi:hypothetical protein